MIFPGDGSLRFEEADINDIEILAALEADCFPEDERASKETMASRIKAAGQFFLVLKEEQSILGFINGTCILSNNITHDSMSNHEPIGRSLVIHSVSVSKQMRRRKLGSAMLAYYVAKLNTDHFEIDRILLLSKAYLINFYISSGFKVDCLSSVVHGDEKWLELSLDLIEARKRDQYIVDAFTLERGSGNPAAIVFCTGGESDRWMQLVAFENNLAETAFLTPRMPRKFEAEQPSAAASPSSSSSSSSSSLASSFDIRWFTPNAEVALCGHATLAAAHVLFESGRVPKCQEPIFFHTRKSGVLRACSSSSTSSSISSRSSSSIDITSRIELDFPSTPPVECVPSSRELELLLLAFPSLAASDLLFFGRTDVDFFVEIKATAFTGTSVMTPGFSYIEQLSSEAISANRGLILTCSAEALSSASLAEATPHIYLTSANSSGRGRYDFFSRFFAPSIAIPEDPVTGSAHCALAPYWIQKFSTSLSTSSSTATTTATLELVGYQASKRGGVVTVSMESCNSSRVCIMGNSVTFGKGKIEYF